MKKLSWVRRAAEPFADIGRLYKILRRLDDLTIPLPLPGVKIYTRELRIGGRALPLRVFEPREKIGRGAILFFHGGGWTSGSPEGYSVFCSALAAQTRLPVFAPAYSLAPENPFPRGLADCYAAARWLFRRSRELGFDSEELIIAGDSAGGNLTAAVCLLAGETGEFLPRSKVLIYPATAPDHGDGACFYSVVQNGRGRLLTAQRIEDYTKLYLSRAALRESKYFAPILEKDADPSLGGARGADDGEVRTLIITAEHDPLRDEGEQYGERLRRRGERVEIVRILGAQHGFLRYPKEISKSAAHTMELICKFIRTPPRADDTRGG